MRTTITILLAFMVSMIIGPSPPLANIPEAPPKRFSICNSAPRVNCVVDGDTFWMDGKKIRLAGVDAPETHHANCVEEESLGIAATRSLLRWVNAGEFKLHRATRDRDRYGRLLHSISRNGVTAGDTLVKAGLARRWKGRRQSWCLATRKY